MSEHLDKKYKILIVDDDDLLRSSIGQNLRENNFEVKEANEGEQGLKYALVNHPDLILLDVEIPDLNGQEVIKQLRADAWGKEVPVIFLTSYDTTDEMMKTIAEFNPAFYLRKDSVNFTDIIDHIKKSLKIT